MPNDSDKIEIENVNSPGRVERVDRAKYVAMKKALLSVLPKTSPGLTVAEAKYFPRCCHRRCFPKVPRRDGG